MNVKLTPHPLAGNATAPPSKSAAHRKLICAALADSVSTLRLSQTSDDLDATIRCLRALGAKIEQDGELWQIEPPKEPVKSAMLDCGESGSTLRFLLPVAAALGVNATFVASGRLPQRPMEQLLCALRDHGVSVSNGFPLKISGKLRGGDYVLPGDISSQFATGLLLALPLCEEPSTLTLTGSIESAPYLALTQKVLRSFGIEPIRHENRYEISPARPRGGSYGVEGDWSNGAALLCLGAAVQGLSFESAQGDKEILPILERFGAKIEIQNGWIRADLSDLHGCEIDAADIPDLVPVLASVAATAKGETRIFNAARLRMKESDRLQSTAALVSTLGGEAKETADGLLIRGKETLSGGTVDSFGDHRIVMAAAVAAQKCRKSVIIRGAQAIGKSFPSFFEIYRSLGGVIDVV